MKSTIPSKFEDLVNDYYDLIDLSDGAKQPPQFSLRIIGLVGAGKSTVLKKLCKFIPMAIVSGDELRRLIYERHIPEQESDTIAAVNRIIASRLKKEGYRVAYDNDSANPIIREQMMKDDQILGIPTIWIQVAPPEKFILQKLRTYKHTYLFKDADEAIAVYERRKRMHSEQAKELEKLPYVYTFDTSAADLDSQVDQAVRIIRHNLKLK